MRSGSSSDSAGPAQTSSSAFPPSSCYASACRSAGTASTRCSFRSFPDRADRSKEQGARSKEGGARNEKRDHWASLSSLLFLHPFSPAVSDVRDVAVLDDVVLAFQAKRAFGTRISFGAGFEKLVPADGFCPYEVLLEVRVNRARCLLRPYAARNGPGATLVFADGEE